MNLKLGLTSTIVEVHMMCSGKLINFFLLLFVTIGNPILTAAEPERYNIITILTDDQARWSVGAYGNREVRTPNMDRIAREGATFLNAFVPTPVCSPSRVSYLTGLYGSQVGITDFLCRPEEQAGMGLPRTAITWPAVLKHNGYATALIGKWHLGTLPQFHPTRHGFDHFYGWLLTPQSIDPVLEIDGKDKQIKGSLPDIMVDEAMRYVTEQRDRTFALLINFLAPHHPYGPVLEEDRAPYKELDVTVPMLSGLDIDYVKEETRKYYASVHSVDRNLGRLLKHLDDLDLTRKTIVLFTSDHGYMIGHHHMQHKGNGVWIVGGMPGPRRPNMFEESIRVPLLIRWPGVVKPGATISESVSNIDTFASVLGMLGVAMPKDYKQQGIDFSPLLRGQTIPARDALVGQYDLHNGGLAYMRMIRTDEWKLIRHYKTHLMDELYNLKDDAGEMKNLYADPATKKIREDLQTRLETWMRSIDDPLLR
jgi:uncharacterized sulfatase